jgi:hypothetical protein
MTLKWVSGKGCEDVDWTHLLQTATGGGFFSCSNEPQVLMKGEEFVD